jgi:predicted ATP-dependent endonuclease of OLD family
MSIRAVYVRNFKSLQSVDLRDCGQVNILIGKNNSGKSTVLNAIAIALSHLGGKRIATNWRSSRPIDDFTDRRTALDIQIGLDITVPTEVNKAIRDALKPAAIGLDAAVDNIAERRIMSAIISIAFVRSSPIIFVSSISASPLQAESGGKLRGAGSNLFSLSAEVADELVSLENEAEEFQRSISEIDEITSDSSRLDFMMRDRDTGRLSARGLISSRQGRLLEELFRSAGNPEEARQALFQRRAYLLEAIEEKRKTPTQGDIHAFAGTVHVLPEYTKILMDYLGKTPLLYFRERREAIGPDEAQQLLQLKTRRGGTERLNTLQKTIRALLGVNIDAFEADASSRVTPASSRPRAEMDIDEFLVEANGAGIREALRIILDLELKSPQLTLIEEPEVHLHPGLERVMQSYLTGKSEATQIFLATHSTSFLDTTFRQNIYVLSRSRSGPTNVALVASEEDALRAVAEVGLRPSSVLMFDKLIFVEGPTDEAVLREFARKLELDFAIENVGIVQMGGSSRFAHYAADATIDLLSKRRIEMWFLIDRDEKDQQDIKRMILKLGDRAQLITLAKREIENYLLDAAAIKLFIRERTRSEIDENEIKNTLSVTAKGMKERAVQLRCLKALCQPLFIDRVSGSVTERLQASKIALEERIAAVAETEQRVLQEVESTWDTKAESTVPGSEILEAVLAKYGTKYNKTSDGPRIAELMNVTMIDNEIVVFLRNAARPNIYVS